MIETVSVLFGKAENEIGWDSLVGTATRYGLDGPGIQSRWGQDFPHLSRPALGPTSHLHNGYRAFFGGKTAGAWGLATQPI
jgi:hypothetical protein